MHLYQDACAFRASALAVSTTRQYAAHIRYFAAFCAYFGLGFETPLEVTVCAYVALLARSVAPATVQQYLKGLKDFYRGLGYAVFGDPMAWRSLYRELKGITRLGSKAVGKKLPITPGMLLAFRQTLGDLSCPEWAAMWACALTAFFGFFRKSNVAVRSRSVTTDGKCIRWGDVRVIQGPAGPALEIAVPSSKTRLAGRAPACYIQGQPGHPLCPVTAWQWHRSLNAAPGAELQPAFSYTSAAGVRASLSHADVVQMAKFMASLVGVSVEDVAGHSFRRGGATWAYRMGAEDRMIQRQGDWRSMLYREYCDDNRETALRTTSIMLAGMPAESAGWAQVEMPAAEAPEGHLSEADRAALRAVMGAQGL